MQCFLLSPNNKNTGVTSTFLWDKKIFYGKDNEAYPWQSNYVG